MSVDDTGTENGGETLNRRRMLGMVGGVMAASAGVGQVAAAESGGSGPSYEVYGMFSDEDAAPEALQRAMARFEDESEAAEALDGAVYQTNGCGAEDGVDVPDGNWGGCCDAHDICYGVGGDASDRLECDNMLYGCMSAVTNQAIANTYYLAVRAGGSDAFNWE